MAWPTWLPTKRSLFKSARDVLVLAVPAALLWLADASNTDAIVQWTHVSPELASKATAYAGVILFGYRWLRGLKSLPGSEPK